jgi:hypothetical protein
MDVQIGELVEAKIVLFEPCGVAFVVFRDQFVIGSESLVAEYCLSWGVVLSVFMFPVFKLYEEIRIVKSICRDVVTCQKNDGCNRQKTT